MRAVLAVAAVVLLAVGPESNAGEPAAHWRPAAGPLTTRWAADVQPDTVWPEYPRPQLVREAWLNLNGLWQFEIVDPAAEVGAPTNSGAPTSASDAVDTSGAQPPLGRDLAETILVPFPVESALSGIGRPAERVWYRRMFEVPAEWRSQRIVLHFGAVDWETRVWVNGRLIGTHRGGYDPFSFDITAALGESGPQELVVGVWDPTDRGTQPRGKQVRNPHSIWYTPTTGIWQTVWLEPQPSAAIERLDVASDIERGALRLTVVARGTGSEHRVEAVARIGAEQVAVARGAPGEPIELVVREPRLWSPDDPFLYDLDVALRDDEQTVDQVQSYFGLREVSLAPDASGKTRLMVNGRFVFQMGLLDQGFWPDGLYTAPTDEALRYDLLVSRQLGFNLVRKHVKVEPARWYYWCDKLGLLVWQDMPSGDAHVGRGQREITRSAESAAQFEEELARVIDALECFPSIVMWVVFNEGWGQFDTVRLTAWVQERDPTRWVSSASGWNDMGVGHVHDIHVYPGPDSPRPEENRAAVLGEFGGLGLPLTGHTWQDEKNWGYRNLKSTEELAEQYARLIDSLAPLIVEPGLSAAVYTQTTDVEIEVNGLVTYDREVIKLTPDEVAKRHARLQRVTSASIEPLVPTSQEVAQSWRYTTDLPASAAFWYQPQFDDRQWRSAPGGFGTHGTPGAVVRTEWSSDAIWLRRTFELAALPEGPVFLHVHHDEDAEVYLNGVLAARLSGFTTGYRYVLLAGQALEALRVGENHLAVSCRQTGGGQYIDLGLVEIRGLDADEPTR